MFIYIFFLLLKFKDTRLNKELRQYFYYLYSSLRFLSFDMYFTFNVYLNNIAVWHYITKTKEVNNFQLAIKNKEKQISNK